MNALKKTPEQHTTTASSSNLNKTAHIAGILYFIFMILGLIGEFVLPNYLITGDAAATAQKVVDGEPLYRLSIVTALATHFLFIFLVIMLYKLFRDVNKFLSLQMVLWVSIGVTLSLANLIVMFVPLMLLNGGHYLSVFTKDQLDNVVYIALRIQRNGVDVIMSFWGLWLLPFGLLVIRSGFIPRVIGYLLLVAGFAYLATSILYISWPESRHLVFRIMMPLYTGELPVIFWLLIAGARPRQSVA